MSFGFEIRGLDEVKKRIDDLAKAAGKLEGEHAVKFDDLFTPAFMRKYTRLQTIDEFVKATGYKADTQADFDAIPITALDSFVRARTQFKDWEDMLGKAVEEYTARELGFDT
ncbi:MAG: hypothetical protein ABFD77_00755 [Thermotogota bacterium]